MRASTVNGAEYTKLDENNKLPTTIFIIIIIILNRKCTITQFFFLFSLLITIIIHSLSSLNECRLLIHSITYTHTHTHTHIVWYDVKKVALFQTFFNDQTYTPTTIIIINAILSNWCQRFHPKIPIVENENQFHISSLNDDEQKKRRHATFSYILFLVFSWMIEKSI